MDNETKDQNLYETEEKIEELKETKKEFQRRQTLIWERFNREVLLTSAGGLGILLFKLSYPLSVILGFLFNLSVFLFLLVFIFNVISYWYSRKIFIKGIKETDNQLKEWKYFRHLIETNSEERKEQYSKLKEGNLFDKELMDIVEILNYAISIYYISGWILLVVVWIFT